MRYIYDLSCFRLFCLRPLVLLLQKKLNYFSFQSFNLSISVEGYFRNAVRPKFDIYVFIT